MADQKVSALTKLATPATADLLYIIDDPNGTPASKAITLKSLFGAVPANTVFQERVTAQANVTVTGSNSTFTSNVNATGITKLNQLQVSNNELRINSSQTPANSTITKTEGTIFWDSNYIYVVTSNNNVKRVALSSF